MTTFYLICFVVGFTLTILSLLMGHLNLHFHLHPFDASAHGLHQGLGHLHHGSSTGSNTGISPINSSSVMAFLTWFGGMGYLLSHYYHFWLLLGLLMATLSGLGGGAVVFLFMIKVLAPRQSQLDPEDYDLVGTLARISSPVRANGTGEIIYSQAGARKTSGARSVDAGALEKGTEVVITKYEKGIAYVQRWEEFTK